MKIDPKVLSALEGIKSDLETFLTESTDALEALSDEEKETEFHEKRQTDLAELEDSIDRLDDIITTLESIG
jgi:hypothetical protein